MTLVKFGTHAKMWSFVGKGHFGRSWNHYKASIAALDLNLDCGFVQDLKICQL